MAGLNPHAGEDGEIGREEIEIIVPAIEALRGTGATVLGPLSADTLFHAEARAKDEAALCMYHDQALIPIKTLAFWDGVNVTLGLPIVRPSPDHGTALDIAGQGIADTGSFQAAVGLATKPASRRPAAGGQFACGDLPCLTRPRVWRAVNDPEGQMVPQPPPELSSLAAPGQGQRYVGVPACQASRLRSRCSRPAVRPRNTGTTPGGSVITSSVTKTSQKNLTSETRGVTR